MLGDKLERRTFLKYCTATAIGSSLMVNPLDIFSNNDTSKVKREKFKLSKPRWVIYDNGTYDLISDEIVLLNCRPSINGQGVMPKNVFLGDSPKGKRIVYELPGGFLMLDLKTNKDTISIGTEFSGFSKAPRWFYPISQAEVFGVDHFFKQGYGTNGTSGIFPILGEVKASSKLLNFSHDSFMTFGFMGKEETMAIGNLDGSNFLQRFTLYNRAHSNGLQNKETSENKVFFEAAMLLDETNIENEYIKLPELHFVTGNRPFETFQELAWRTCETMEARLGTTTSYHWISSATTHSPTCCQNLKDQIEFVKKNALPLHTFCIRNYCIEGDWLEPNKSWTGGLDNAARTIFKDGYRAGISISPFRISEESKIFKTHKDWLVRNNNNDIKVEEIIKGENFYALDASHPGVQKYISKVFKTLRKMGYIFFETPHLEYGLQDSYLTQREVQGKSSVQIFREICSIIRTEIGPGSLWMADQTPYSPLIGFADIVQLNNLGNREWNNEKLKSYIRESWYSHYFNNIYWQNYLGEIEFNNQNGLSETQQQSLALWTSMLGGAVGTSDDITNWTSKQQKLFQFLEPSKRQQSAELPFWPNIDEIKVAVRTYKNLKSWSVLFFNDKDETIHKEFTIQSLIEKEEAYVFLWDKKGISYGEQFEITVSLNPYQSMLFYLSEKNEGPDSDLCLGGALATKEPEKLS
jgi:hypothetical protein